MSKRTSPPTDDLRPPKKTGDITESADEQAAAHTCREAGLPDARDLFRLPTWQQAAQFIKDHQLDLLTRALSTIDHWEGMKPAGRSLSIEDIHKLVDAFEGPSWAIPPAVVAFLHVSKSQFLGMSAGGNNTGFQFARPDYWAKYKMAFQGADGESNDEVRLAKCSALFKQLASSGRAQDDGKAWADLTRNVLLITIDEGADGESPYWLCCDPNSERFGKICSAHEYDFCEFGEYSGFVQFCQQVAGDPYCWSGLGGDPERWELQDQEIYLEDLP